LATLFLAAGHATLHSPFGAATLFSAFGAATLPSAFGAATLPSALGGATLPSALGAATLPPVAVVLARASPIPTSGFATLHTFAGGGDAEEPCGGPLVDPAGNIFVSLYFATRAPNQGALFELKPSAGRYSDSIARAIDPEAGRPCSSPFENATGQLFVTTIAGGQTTGHGAVVKLVPTPNGYRESARSQLGYRARTHPGVPRPSGVGTLFGPAVERGATLYLSAGPGGTHGAGAILALHEDDLSYESVYDFRGTVRLPQRSSDGFWPMPGLLADRSGTLYGATLRGGSQSAGTVFEVMPARGVGRERVLWTFHHFDGALPTGGLVRVANGALYGTTLGGGKYDKGVVFELTPVKGGYRERLLHEFRGSPDGAYPSAGLTLLHGVLYGTTEEGGSTAACEIATFYNASPLRGCGTLFGLSTSGTGYSVLHRFNGSDGADPASRLVAYGDALYGVTLRVLTRAGGYPGTIYRFAPASIRHVPILNDQGM
jgi:uncharacterized repeat protein (TIGR03803 family)